MAAHCTSCSATTASGKRFFRCKKCGAVFCSSCCGGSGSKCPMNCGGFIQ